VHAADVEGLCQGIDEDLVARTFLRNLVFQPNGALLVLGKWATIPTTYAGGAKGEPLGHRGLFSPALDISDLSTVQRLSDGRVDLTYGRLATCRFYACPF